MQPAFAHYYWRYFVNFGIIGITFTFCHSFLLAKKSNGKDTESSIKDIFKALLQVMNHSCITSALFWTLSDPPTQLTDSIFETGAYEVPSKSQNPTLLQVVHLVPNFHTLTTDGFCDLLGT